MTEYPDHEARVVGFPREHIDAGILHEVEVLDRYGVETFESCEGGEGHAFHRPTVRFHGNRAAGWRALAVCYENGLDAISLSREWPIIEGIPTGPYWVLEFRQKVKSS